MSYRIQELMLAQRDTASPRGRLVSSLPMNGTEYDKLNSIKLCMIMFLFAEVLSTKIIPLKQKVEVAEGGDAMEE